MIDPVEPPTYEALLAENMRLRQRVSELERVDAKPAPESPVTKVRLHKLDPNATDAFRRPAYSRRTK